MLTVYSSRVGCNDRDVLDITVKTGSAVFAPTWDMVMGYKNGKLTKAQYTEQYTELMRQSFRSNKKEWAELLKRDRVVLVCYCGKGAFCHRILLAEMLMKCGAVYEGEI